MRKIAGLACGLHSKRQLSDATGLSSPLQAHTTAPRQPRAPDTAISSMPCSAGGARWAPDQGSPNHRRAACRWEAVPWVKVSAYTLYGLSPPWELEGGGIDAGFRTSESGQMLVNRCARTGR